MSLRLVVGKRDVSIASTQVQIGTEFRGMARRLSPARAVAKESFLRVLQHIAVVDLLSINLNRFCAHALGDMRLRVRHFVFVLSDEIDRIVSRHGAAIEIALRLLAAFLLQGGRLRRLFHAFRRHRQS